MKAAVALLALGLAAIEECSILEGPAYTCASEEHWMRLDGAGDTAEFFSLQRGIAPGEGDSFAHLRSVIARRRLLPAEGGFLSWDLDEKPSAEELATMDASERELLRLLPSVSVAGAGLALDDAGRVCLWRRVKVGHASEWLQWLEQGDRLDPGPDFREGEWPAFDKRSRELQEEAWQRGERFWSIEGDSLRLDLPSTSENAACIAAAMLDGALAGENEIWPYLGTSLRDIEVGGDRMRLRLGPDSTGWMRVFRETATEPPTPFDPAVLRAEGFEIESAQSLSARAPPVRP